MRTIAITVFAFLLAGCFGGGPRHVSNAAVGRYGHHLHDVFYEAWMEPETVSGAARKNFGAGRYSDRQERSGREIPDRKIFRRSRD